MSSHVQEVSGTAELSENEVFRKVGRRLLPILLLSFIVAQLDRINIGFAKFEMARELAFSDAIYGLGAGIFFIGYLIFEVPSNLIIGRVGARRWIARIMISWGIVSACTLFVRTPMQFYIARFLLGVAEAGFAPGVLWYLANWFPARYRGRAVAFYLSSVPVAGVIGGLLSGAILHFFVNTPPLSAWQWLFLLEALPAILMGFVVLRVLTDSVQDAHWLTDSEKTMIVTQIAHENRHKHADGSLLAVCKLPIVWGLTLIFFCVVMGIYGLNFWLPSLVRKAGFTDPWTIGWVSAIPYLVATVANIVSAYSADHTGKRRLHFCATMFIGAIGLSGSMLFSGHAAMTVLLLSVAAAGIIPAMILFYALPYALLAGSTAAAGFAIINSLGNLAGFVSPYMVGQLNATLGHSEAGMYVIAGFLLVGGVAAMTLSSKRVDDV
jgi:MFS family permease